MRWLLCASVMAVLSGCHAYSLDVDGRIAERSAQPIDVRPVAAPPKTLPELPSIPMEPEQTRRPQRSRPTASDAELVLVQGKKEVRPMLERLTFTEDILGIKVPDIYLPRKDIKKEIAAQFPPLPKPRALPEAMPGPDGQALTLTDLQQIALRTSPLIRQAHLDIEAARGFAVQVGLYPNPTFGYEGSTIGQGNNDGKRSPGQQGSFAEQTIVTMGKLTLARTAALRDVQIAEQNLKKTESDLQSQVRSGYFAVLSANENFRVTKGLTALTDELYNVLLLQLQAGFVAAYEPMQIRVLALQSRNTLNLAYNRYVSSWKQLAATLGMPTMPLTALAGQIDMPLPQFKHDQVLAFVLENHTDNVAAQLAVERQRLLVRLAEVQPFPDITVHTAFQRDYTTPPFGAVANINVGVPFPLWNRNQGGIQTARAELRRALEDTLRVRNELTARVAAAFERYDNNRVLVDTYKKNILPNQVQAFRAAVARHVAEGDKVISYNDVVMSQQTLVGLVNSYLGALSEQWSSVVEISNLLQTRDLFQNR
ncbi:MAG: TolC family protein [Gemmataceae bacterium]|nr:TolC family protein [Gemmataceae bacterium]